MKEKRSPKLKIEEIRRQIKNDALTCLEIVAGLYPDKITVQGDGSAEIYFAPDNPQTKHAVKGLLILEQDGYITFEEELLWNGPGFDVTSMIRVNNERFRIPSQWERVKEFLGIAR